LFVDISKSYRFLADLVSLTS